MNNDSLEFIVATSRLLMNNDSLEFIGIHCSDYILINNDYLEFIVATSGLLINHDSLEFIVSDVSMVLVPTV